MKLVYFNSQEKLTNIEKQLISVSEDQTKVQFDIKNLNGPFFLVEEIPKEIANHVDEINFSHEPIVIEEDPLIVWYFPETLDKVTKFNFDELETSWVKKGNWVVKDGKLIGSGDSVIQTDILYYPDYKIEGEFTIREIDKVKNIAFDLAGFTILNDIQNNKVIFKINNKYNINGRYNYLVSDFQDNYYEFKNGKYEFSIESVQGKYIYKMNKKKFIGSATSYFSEIHDLALYVTTIDNGVVEFNNLKVTQQDTTRFYEVDKTKEEVESIWPDYNTEYRNILLSEISPSEDCKFSLDCEDNDLCIMGKCYNIDVFKCGTNAELKEGICRCLSGYKLCNNNCIPIKEKCDSEKLIDIHESIIINRLIIDVLEEESGYADAIIEIDYTISFFGDILSLFSDKDYITNFVNDVENSLDAKIDIISNDLKSGKAKLRFHNFASISEGMYYTYNITAYPMKELIIKFPDCHIIQKKDTKLIEHIKYSVGSSQCKV